MHRLHPLFCAENRKHTAGRKCLHEPAALRNKRKAVV